MPATIVRLSIGTRTSDSVTVSAGGVTNTTVTGFSNAWNVVLSASVPATTVIGDKLTTGANSYLITNTSGSTLTVVGDASAPLTSTTTPSTGSATTSRAYASPAAWFDGFPTNLKTPDSNNGWVWKGELYKEGPGTNGEWTSFPGKNVGNDCDATRYNWLVAAPGQSFNDNANKLTNALRYNAANGVAISFGAVTAIGLFASGLSPRLRIDNLQFNNTTGGQWVVNANGGIAIINNCIVRNAVFRAATSVTNTLSYLTVNEYFWRSADYSSGTNSNFHNCTIIGGGSTTNAFQTRTNDSGLVIKNCAIFNFPAIADLPAKISSSNSTYNATNLTSFGWTGTGNIDSLTYANQFENTGAGTEDFRAKAGNSFVGAGIRDQTFTSDVDIVGAARSTGTAPSGPTIGAWEFPLITYTYARPASDITTQWSTSSGSTHYTLIDETVADDTDYIVATAAGQTDEVKLQSMTPPQVGTNLVINYKVTAIDGAATVTVSLRQGSAGTLIKTDTAKSVNGTYALTVAPADWAAVTDWSDLRLRFVSA